METKEECERVSSELSPVLMNLSFSSDKTSSADTTISGTDNMPNGSGRKRSSPRGADGDMSSAEDDIGGRPGSTYKIYGSDYNKAIQVGEKHKYFRFMDLPSEIRNKIYMKTLATADGTFHIGTEHCPRLGRRRAHLATRLFPLDGLSNDADQPIASTRNLALLRASRTIHAEAGQILYGQRLEFTCLTAMQDFLAGLKPAQLGLLRHVALPQDFGGDAAWMPGVFAFLAGADSLETLYPGIERMWLPPLRLSDVEPHVEGTVSIGDWDAAVARNLADSVYYRMFTYLRRAVPARGIDKIMEVLDIFEEVFRMGPGNYLPEDVRRMEWTKERKVAMKKAMSEEIVRLIQADNN